MFKSIVVLALAAIAVSDARYTPTKYLGEDWAKIVGGEIAIDGQFPHQVALFQHTLGTTAFHCGGSILNQKWVVTAAHCTTGILLPNQISARAGEQYLDEVSGHEQEHRALSIHRHPDYDSTTQQNDIALIELNGAFTWTDYVQPIALPEANSEVESGDMIVSGWGSTFEGAGVIARRLHFVHVPFVNDVDCQVNYVDNEIASSMICAGTTGKDSCQGDSGGPLTFNSTLTGIVSWGIGCAREGYPGVYTQVSHFRDFIKSVSGL